MDIPFDGTYDQKTYRRALALIEKKTVGKTILRWLALIALVAALGAGIYDWVDRGARAEDLPRLARPALTAVLLGYYYVSPAITRQVRTSRMFQGKESRRMNGFVDLEGIVVGPVQGKTGRFPWSQFVRSWQEGSLVVLVTVEGNLAVFQREFFQSEAEWGRFLQWVGQRVGEDGGKSLTTKGTKGSKV